MTDRAHLTPDQVKFVALPYLNCTWADIVRHDRRPPIVKKRWVLAWLIRRYSGLGYIRLGEEMHRHFTTVWHGVLEVEEWWRTDTGRKRLWRDDLPPSRLVVEHAIQALNAALQRRRRGRDVVADQMVDQP